MNFVVGHKILEYDDDNDGGDDNVDGGSVMVIIL